MLWLFSLPCFVCLFGFPSAGAAYACRCEHLLGQVAEGFAADFVLLDRNVVDDPEALLSAEVDVVVVGGRVVFNRDEGRSGDGEAPIAQGAHVPGRNGDLSATRFSSRTTLPEVGFCKCCGFKLSKQLEKLAKTG